MHELRLEMTLDAPVEGVFEAMADHARYNRFRPIKHSELITEGDVDRNGVGAVRRLGALGIRFEEEITACEYPSRIDYLIRKVNLPLHHEGGSIRFEPEGEGTGVLWTSTFEVTVPVLRTVLEPLGSATLKRSFRQMLEDSAELATQAPSVSDRPAMAG